MFPFAENNTKVCPSRVDPERRSMIQPLKASGDRIPGVCLKNRAGGSPIAGRFIVENSKQKMMIYGYRHFRKPTSLGRSKQWSTLTVMVSPTPLQEMGQNIHYPVVIQGGSENYATRNVQRHDSVFSKMFGLRPLETHVRSWSWTTKRSEPLWENLRWNCPSRKYTQIIYFGIIRIIPLFTIICGEVVVIYAGHHCSRRPFPFLPHHSESECDAHTRYQFPIPRVCTWRAVSSQGSIRFDARSWLLILKPILPNFNKTLGRVFNKFCHQHPWTEVDPKRQWQSLPPYISR